MPKRTHQIITTTSGHCYVSLGNRRVYLGPAGREGTELEYHRVVLEYLSGRLDAGQSLASVLYLYIDYARDYYAGSSQTRVVRAATQYLTPYLDRRADRFAPMDLDKIRRTMAHAGLTRRTINHYVGVIRQMFKWAVSRGLVHPETHQALTTLPPLRAGRTPAPDPAPVGPVPEEHVTAIRDYVRPAVWAMVQLQLFTGCRPGEVVIVRPCDVDTSGTVWEYRPVRHKGTWRGRCRVVYLGPQAQDVLRPYLLRDRDAWCFESRPGRHYSTCTYRTAIASACKRAGVPCWPPNQLRHTAATRVRRAHGLEAAQVVLGHSRADVTQIYAERDATLARKIAEKMG